MAGVYFDGDSSGAQWMGTSNLSPSLISALGTSASNEDVGDLIAQSWDVEESATPVDILDTSGSVGGISASFKRIPEMADNTPTASPPKSSDYLHGQACTFTHEKLGTINGNVLNIGLNGGTIEADISTPLSVLNVDMDMPVYAEGSYFYSWDRTLADGRVWPGITDIVTNIDGNIWITGGLTGGNALRLYDRFGNFLQSISHTGYGRSIDLDAFGNIYLCTETDVQKFAPDGTSLGTLVTASGYSLVKMCIDRYSGNIWVATTDSTIGGAIKKYTLGGTFVLQSSTYYPPGAPPGGASYNYYTGMRIKFSDATATSTLIVGNRAKDGAGGNLFYINRINVTDGSTVGPYPLGTSNREFSNLGIAMSNLLTPEAGNYYKEIFFSQTGLYRESSSYLSKKITVPTGKTVAMDSTSGGGYWVAIDSTLYRFSGEYLGINQAIECYLGAAGYRGKVTYDPNTLYNDIYDAASVYKGFPAWSGNLWTKLKELAARGSRVITTDGTGILIAKDGDRTSGHEIDIQDFENEPQISIGQPGAQIINLTSQNVTRVIASVLYTAPVDSASISVGYGELSTVTIQANVYPTHIDPPIAVNAMSGGSSRYSIVDSSSPPLPVAADAWIKARGQVIVSQNASSPGSIDVTLIGPSQSLVGYTAPFSVGYMRGAERKFGLVLTGSGIRTNPTTTQIYTGAPFQMKSDIKSTDIDSIFLDTTSIAYDMARISSSSLSGGEVTLSVNLPVATLNATFGKIAGKFFYWNRNLWRIRTVKISGGWVDIDAVRDTRSSDIQSSIYPVTHGSIDSVWYGYRYQDNYISPGVLGR